MDLTPETDLLAASEHVAAFVDGEIDFRRFLSLYDNYYYTAALDGHEGGEIFLKFLEANRALVELHKNVQQLLDSVYASSDGSGVAAHVAGRLSIDEAHRRIVEVAEHCGLARELNQLRGKLAE